MKRIIISGGGTGGHIYPAITIYKEIMKMTDAEVLYIGTEKGLEASLVPKEGIDFKTLPVQGLERKLSFGTIKTLFKSVNSLIQASSIISEFEMITQISFGHN